MKKAPPPAFGKPNATPSAKTFIKSDKYLSPQCSTFQQARAKEVRGGLGEGENFGV